MSKKSLDLDYMKENMKLRTGVKAGAILYGISIPMYGIPWPWPILFE